MRGLLAEKRALEGVVGASKLEVAELQEDAQVAAAQQAELEEGLAALGGLCEELEAQLREAIAREAAVCIAAVCCCRCFGSDTCRVVGIR